MLTGKGKTLDLRAEAGQSFNGAPSLLTGKGFVERRRPTVTVASMGPRRC